MWFPRLPCGSNIASWKPVNLRRESTPSAARLSSPGPRGMSSLCRIMIFFQVRTFTLQSKGMQRGWTIPSVTPQRAPGCKLSSLKYLQWKATWTKTPRRRVEDLPHTQCQACRACWIRTDPTPWTTPGCSSSSSCCKCGDCKSTIGWRSPAAAQRQNLSSKLVLLISSF